MTRESNREWSQQTRLWAKVAAVAAAYFVTGRLGLLLAIEPGLTTPVWLPSGIAVAAALVWGPRIWPGIWLGSFSVNVSVLIGSSSLSASATSLSVMALIATGSTLQALLAMFLARRFIGPSRPFDRARDVLVFATIAVLSCLVAPTVGATGQVLGGFVSWADYGVTWLTWWVGDVVGILVVTPLPLSRVKSPRGRWGRGRWIEAGLFLLALLVTGQILLGNPFFLSAAQPLRFPFLPFLVWAALRFGHYGVVLTAVLISTLAIGGAVRGWGTFSGEQLHESLLLLQLFVGMVVVTGLVLAAAFSERQRAEHALRESDARKSAMLEAGLDAIISIDQRGLITEWNPAAAEIFGYSRAAALGNSLAELIVPPGLREAHREGMQRYLTTGESRVLDQRIEMPALRADGSEFPVELAITRIPLPGPPTFMAFVRDISERKRAERTVRESEERERQRAAELETVLSAVPAIVWISHDPECRHVSGNRLADEFLRLPPGAEASLTAPLEVRPAHFKILQDGRELSGEELPVQLAARGVSVHSFEEAIVFDDGTARHLVGNATPLYDADGRPRGSVAAFVDITERKQAEEELRQLNATLEHRIVLRTAQLEERSRQLRRLAVEMSAAEQRERKRIATTLHDHLQQILVAAKYRLDQLRRGVAADGFDQKLQELVESVDTLIAESINASRTLTVELSPPVLYERGLGASLIWLQRQFREKHGMEIAVSLAEEAEPADQDVQAFLFQSVRELLFNIVKHADTDRAEISMVRNSDREVEITVTDFGVGCEPERIVQRADTDGGFGLFSIQQRIDLLGGRFHVEAAPGAGCRITLSVALDQLDNGSPTEERTGALPAISAATGPAGVNHRTIRVLIADDHRIVREGLIGLLGLQPGIEIIGEAEDGRTAVALAAQLRPDVIVMDVTMPIMDGIDATRSIKHEFPQVRVVGLSMHEEEDLAEAMCNAGASAYVTKGGPSDALIAAIRG